MPTDISGKRIIMVHGLGSKPPQPALDDLWSRCLVENIRVNNKSLAGKLDQHPETFLSGYWADATPHHIPDDSPYVRKLRRQVDLVIAERQRMKGRFHVGLAEKIGAFFKNRGVDLVKLMTSAFTLQEEVMKTLLSETRLYDEDQYIADRMRRPLEEALRRAWDDGCEVALLAHSMGTFIAYDVLWRFSHRQEAEFRDYRKKRVRMLVTMGSPLCDGVIQQLLFARYHKPTGPRGRRHFPTNIDFWHNYSCLGDIVSHSSDFEECYFQDMRRLGLLPKRLRHRAIDYHNLHNPFEVVAHGGNRDRVKRNPHKSYGYLVQPRLGTWLIDFLKSRLQ